LRIDPATVFERRRTQLRDPETIIRLVLLKFHLAATLRQSRHAFQELDSYVASPLWPTQLCHARQNSSANHFPEQRTLGQLNAGGAYPAIVKRIV